MPRGDNVTLSPDAALRDPKLRRYYAVVVLLFVTPGLAPAGGQIKVNATASALAMTPRRVRRALAWLCRLQYLRLSHREPRAVGFYMPGVRMGGSAPPVATPGPLQCDACAGEGC